MRPVKSPAGSLRADRADATRRRILSAARSLFAARGYGATTLREIADEAGVAVQTVYAVFESKANVLRVLREEVRDDPAADAAFGAALQAPTVRAALDAFAHSIRVRWEVGHDVVAANIDAASTDPSIRADVEAVLETRRRGIGRLGASFVERGFARDAAHASAVLDALSMPEVYAELTRVHGWSPDAYEAWLAAALRATLDVGANGAGGRRTAGSKASADRGPTGTAGQLPAATSDR